jgi:hypothetical protein
MKVILFYLLTLANEKVLLGDRTTAVRQTLNLVIKVRILVPQPYHTGPIV